MRLYYLLLLTLASICILAQEQSSPYIIALGITQDAGYPQIGCSKECCQKAWKEDSLKRTVVSLALVDPQYGKWWLFEATPDIKEQLQVFSELTKNKFSFLPQGIFITHAHMGHYTGLMELGRESMNSQSIPVMALPKFCSFMENNGPWNQLVKLKNISLNSISVDSVIKLSSDISVQTFTVPHRDEFSETAGFRILTNDRKYIFIPDIDKWTQWKMDVRTLVKENDICFLDATFFSEKDLPHRNINEVPHPFVIETEELFSGSYKELRKKIVLIHFNHTNPLLYDQIIRQNLEKKGFKVAVQKAIY